MALSPFLYIQAPLQQVILDKDSGEPLAAGVVSYFSDPAFSVQKDVYFYNASPSPAYVNAGSVLTLSSIGSFVDSSGDNAAVFLFPYDGDFQNEEDPGNFEPYYIRVVSSTGVRQFTVLNWPPNSFVQPSSALEDETDTQNLLTNPQFSQVLFLPTAGGYAFTVSGTDTVTAIAPGWYMKTSGSGTVTLEQLSLISNLESQPAYALDIETTGLTAFSLYQRLANSPRLLYGGVAAGYMLAASTGAAVSLSLTYVPSNGSSFQIVSGTTAADGSYNAISGNVSLSGTVSTDNASGYVDIVITPSTVNTHFQITSVQVAGTPDLADDVSFIQQSTQQEASALFWYKEPLLNFKPIPSLLTAWDFPLNPAQFGSTGNISGSGAYIWDQTIAARGASNVAYARSSVTGGLQFTTPAGTDAFYILQYLTSAEAKKILGTKLSVNVNAYRGSAGADITARVYLFRGSSAATVPTLGTTIGTLASTGVFTVTAANWTQINRDGIGTPSFILNTITTNDQLATVNTDYGYSDWEITDVTQMGDTDKFAIVVTFAYSAINTVVTVNSVSVVPGSIPTRPAPQTADEVLRECQYYYESSYSLGTVPPSIVVNGYTTAPQYISGTSCRASAFCIQYRTEKRIAPTEASSTLKLYSPASVTPAQVRAAASAAGGATTFADVALTNWLVGGEGTKCATYVGNTITNLATQVGATEGYITYEWVADARLGII